MYADCDRDKANEILDGILPDKDGEGYRLRPDGTRFTIAIEYSPIFGPWRDVLEMTPKQWAEVGIYATLREQDCALRTEQFSQAGAGSAVRKASLERSRALRRVFAVPSQDA